MCVWVHARMYSSHVQLFATPWTLAHQAGSSVHRFFRQEYCSGLTFSTPGDLPDPGIKPVSLASSALTGRFFSTSATCTHIQMQCRVFKVPEAKDLLHRYALQVSSSLTLEFCFGQSTFWAMGNSYSSICSFLTFYAWSSEGKSKQD